MSHTKADSIGTSVTPGRLVSALLLIALALPLAASAAPPAGPADKDLKKADKIIAGLRRLAEVSAAGADFGAYEAEIKRAYPRLFVAASEVGESDLKTHLTTAVFMYEAAHRDWPALEGSAADCGAELRESYRRLCRENGSGDRLRLLFSKAALHAEYAAVLTRAGRGATDAGTLAALAEIEAERKADLLLAGRAVALLQGLGVRVKVRLSPTRPGAAGEGNSFEQFAGEASGALAAVDRLLYSMSRGPLRSLIHNARDSYRDGVFWWAKVSRREELTVPVQSLAAADPLKAAGLEEVGVKRAALSNWVSALSYTERAAESVNEALARTGDLAQIAAGEF